MDLALLSTILLYSALGTYSVATVLFGFTLRDKNKRTKKSLAGNIAITITIIGFIVHLGYFITRWIASGHAPLANLFEFMTFLGMSIVLAFIIIYFIYRLNILGLFALPIAVMIIAYASLFGTELSPLLPSLQSPFLFIHVGTVSLSQGILAISFVSGVIYLIRQVNQSSWNASSFWLEMIMLTIFILIGFVVSTTAFNMADYKATFEYEENERMINVDYHMPAIVGPNNGTLLTDDVMEPLFETPGWMKGADAPRKFNTLIWSFLIGIILHAVTALIFRKRIGAVLQPLVQKANPKLLDEITYRAVAIGFPLFTLGGLIFAAIYAQIAWDRFWGWDPKEVWALITWFFYAAFLHLRLSRGWHGEKSAWLAVGGFAIIMFNLIAVNLVISGLHSYA